MGIEHHRRPRNTRPSSDQRANRFATTQHRANRSMVTAHPPQQYGSNNRCFNCGGRGHLSRQCPSPRNRAPSRNPRPRPGRQSGTNVMTLTSSAPSAPTESGASSGPQGDRPAAQAELSTSRAQIAALVQRNQELSHSLYHHLLVASGARRNDIRLVNINYGLRSQPDHNSQQAGTGASPRSNSTGHILADHSDHSHTVQSDHDSTDNVVQTPTQSNNSDSAEEASPSDTRSTFRCFRSRRVRSRIFPPGGLA
ncbi:zinc knuckle [Ostertagia ostertagi]